MARLLLVLALLAPAAIAAATPPAELGTLFHTPEERARLDRLRRGEPTEPAEGTATRVPRTPAVTGYVRRSDGRNTVWVDGTPVATRNDPRTFDPKLVMPRPAPPATKSADGNAPDAKAGTKVPDPAAPAAKSPEASPPGSARPAEPAKR